MLNPTIHLEKDSRQLGLNMYLRVRQDSENLCKPLQAEDYVIQTAMYASPAKWHLAHMTWFFEVFILTRYLPSYTVFHPQYCYLFNSYYEQVGQFYPRPQRGFLSRPTVAEIYRYREYVDNAMRQLIETASSADWLEIYRCLMIGLNHEQQHQELLLTDLKYNFSLNPLFPAYRENLPFPLSPQQLAMATWQEYPGGIYEIGFNGNGFSYDNESPRHRIYIGSFCLASRPVSNGEYLEFVAAGGYSNPVYWLSDGWSTVRREAWQLPLHWREIDSEWWEFTLGGLRRLDMTAPVCHVSYYEAYAYAIWAGKRLPTEAEWEIAATDLPITGNLRDSGYLQPTATESSAGLMQMYGDVWELTASAYQPYPGFRPPSGALGEYNGKFMCNQQVLRGGSCVTPNEHIRSSYRNFFYPHERWQFQGFRLAEDA
jgi:ergothioneine biosynthesis protein EgtB